MYVNVSDLQEMRKYAEKYMPQYKIPLNLTFRSMLRSFETGLVREQRRPRVVPRKIYPLDDLSSIIEFKGKGGIVRKVEVPYSELVMRGWYEDEAKQYKKESYRIWLRNKYGLGTHDGRRTCIINFLLLHGNNMDAQLQILARTGHRSLSEIMPYVREYVTVKALAKPIDLNNIRELMSHIKVG